MRRALEKRWLRQVKSLPLLDVHWRYSRAPRLNDPGQGWKIHVSATPLSAGAVFSCVFPILSQRNVLFKVSAGLESLAKLNTGIPAFSQIGKFITVYPRSTVEAVDLARRLHAATRELVGPEIPFDASYGKRSLVYYRYGSFRTSSKGNLGNGTITDLAGTSHPDRRAAGHAVPRWLDDPFRRSHGQSDHAHFGAALGPDYLPFKVISQRGKGGVYEAVDLSTSPARLVIIKEGRKHGETNWDAQDGYARIKHEGRVLRDLRAAGLPVPEVLREFNWNRNRYLVLEKILGRSLLPRHQKNPVKSSWQRAQRILDQLGALLSILHAAGWVWRDCKPSHILVSNGEMRLIDFEGACPINETQVLPWSSPHYSPLGYHKHFSRVAGQLEDDYALGVIAFQFATGQLPSLSGRGRAKLYKRARAPRFLCDNVERLLRISRRNDCTRTIDAATTGSLSSARIKRLPFR
jgi:tRNA A-37 threonylcarbamoyl transferase component Bud32